MAMAAASPRDPVRLAELLAALSLGVDLGFGQPMEHVLRQTLVALRLADRIGLDDDERAVVYYTSLLVNVGCHTDAHEQAKWFGDDIAMKATKYDHAPRSPQGAAAMLRMLGSGNPPVHRFRVGLAFVLSGHRDLTGMIAGHAAIAAGLATHLGLPGGVHDAVESSYEQWDGRGWPGRQRGDAVPVAARISALAEYVEVAHRLGGPSNAMDVARHGRGSRFDPTLVDAFVADPDAVFDALNTDHTWDTVVSSEPALTRLLTDREFEDALVALADFIDLKSPFTLGHGRAAAALAAAAAARDLPEAEIHLVRRATLVAGYGRLGVSNAILDKRGPLGPGEWERVRMHPYLTERMLRQARALAPLGGLAVQLRERLDGSGYPRGLTGATIDPRAQLVAVADAYQSMVEARPYRAALAPEIAAKELRSEVRAGRLDPEAVEAVLAAAGHHRTARRRGAAGLTDREIEVLRLVAVGRSSRAIADELGMAPKTARNHIEHIYSKIGVTNRAAASLFAVRTGLLPVTPDDPRVPL